MYKNNSGGEPHKTYSKVRMAKNASQNYTFVEVCHVGGSFRNSWADFHGALGFHGYFSSSKNGLQNYVSSVLPCISLLHVKIQIKYTPPEENIWWSKACHVAGHLKCVRSTINDTVALSDIWQMVYSVNELFCVNGVPCCGTLPWMTKKVDKINGQLR